MRQAAVLDGPALDGEPPFQNRLPPSGIDIGGGQIAVAFVVSAVVVVIDEVADLCFEITRQEVALEQYPVLHRLMPALDLALCHRMIGRSAHVFDPPVTKPLRQVARDVVRPVVR